MKKDKIIVHQYFKHDVILNQHFIHLKCILKIFITVDDPKSVLKYLKRFNITLLGILIN